MFVILLLDGCLPITGNCQHFIVILASYLGNPKVHWYQFILLARKRDSESESTQEHCMLTANERANKYDSSR